VTKKLRVTLYLVAAYLAMFGVLFLLAPSVASRLTHTTHDPTLGLLYGQYTLTFALVAFMAARASQAASALSLTRVLFALVQAVRLKAAVRSGIFAHAHRRTFDHLQHGS
jgi:hypothetical protein